MDKSGPWLAIGAVGAFAVAAGLAFSLVAPYWGQPETSTLLAGIVGCPTILLTVGVIFLGLHWRDERSAAREERQASKRGRAIDRHGQDAQVMGLNAAVTRQAIDVISAMAQAQARQSVAGLNDARLGAFQQRAIEPPAQQESWFTGEWNYDDENAEAGETGGGVRYL
jgi:hypothetical protein